MKRSFLFLMLPTLFAVPPADAAAQCSILSHKVDNILGEKEDLCQYAGKVLLVVNTASFCGFTPQYKGLEALDSKYRLRGLVVLGFPSNDFAQETGSNKEIADFCDRTYAVKFPMFAKTAVKDAGQTPLYDDLAKSTGERPKWNFHKYLIARDGKTVASYKSAVDPESKDFIAKVEEYLAQK